jgi:hypothetical protein
LSGSADLLRASVNNQPALIFPLITPAQGLKVRCGRFAVCQVNFPLDLCIDGGDLSRLYQRARVVKGVFIDPETCALSLDPTLVVFLARIWIMRSVRPIQRRRKARRLRAYEILVGAIADSRDTDGRVDAVYVRHCSSPYAIDRYIYAP